MDSVYGMLGAVKGCGWQLCPLGWCLKANLIVDQPSPSSLLQPSGACLDTSRSPLGFDIIVLRIVEDNYFLNERCEQTKFIQLYNIQFMVFLFCSEFFFILHIFLSFF